MGGPTRIWLLALLPFTLAACGGGGGSPVNVPVPPSTSGAPTIAQATALLDMHADPVSYSVLTSIPSTGTAEYAGFAYGDLANTSDNITDSLIGELTVNVTFGAPSTTFSGAIDNFADESGDLIAGSLDLSGGAFDRNGNPSADPTIGITVNGNLTDTQARVLTFNGRLEGDFLGSTYSAMGGEFLGSVSVSGNNQNFDGGFIAER